MATADSVSAMGRARVTAQRHIANLSTEVVKLRISGDMDLRAANSENEVKITTVLQEASESAALLK